ncbi:MAG TPA: hypothetical protein VF449_12565 [Parvibaculum sp.]
MRIHAAMLAVAAVLLTSCGTYDDPLDSYAMGVRWYDRGNYSEAAKLWQLLAEHGDCDAQYRYGHLLWLGLGVKMDKAAAFKFFEDAANAGQPKGQVALGDLAFARDKSTYVCRENCIYDIVVAYKWYLLAEHGAYYEGEKTYVAEALADIRSRMTAAQKLRGEAMATEWHPYPKACEPRHLL